MSEPAHQVEAALAAAVSETMEGMAFESVELAEPASEKPEENLDNLWVSLEIVSPCRGQLIIELPSAYAEIVARSMYGDLEEAIPAEVIKDTLAELSNTLAGRFMLVLLGPNTDYSLGFPVTGRGDCPVQEDRVNTLVFTGSGYDMTVAVTGADFERITSDSNLQNTKVMI